MTTKIKRLSLIILLPLLIGGFFYAHIFIKPNNGSYNEAEATFLKYKAANKKALNEVKHTALNTKEYATYKAVSEKKISALKKLNIIKEEQKIFGFKSLHFFMERFGDTTIKFLFSLYFLFITVKGASKLNKWTFYGRVIIICAFMSTTFFSFFWIFQSFQDFSKITYYIITLLSAYFVFLATRIFVNRTKTNEEKLKAHLMEVAKFTFTNTKPEKRQEMINLMQTLVKN